MPAESFTTTTATSVESSCPPVAFATSCGREEAIRRITALVVAIGAGVVLAVAAGLEPAGRGLGTHEQLNLPACGWITLMDLPCPTCGMTTSFSHAAHGDLLASFAAQPLGCLLALGTAMAFIVAVYVVATGSRVGGVFTRLWGRYTGWLLTAMVLAAWGFKVVTYRGLL